jgi:hypothetical protein
VHTDIVSHSANGFPTRTAEEFLEFLRSIPASGPSVPHPTPTEIFVSGHPAAMAFVNMPKPFPASFAKEHFFAVTAFKFTNAERSVRYGRYRILPESALNTLKLPPRLQKRPITSLMSYSKESEPDLSSSRYSCSFPRTVIQSMMPPSNGPRIAGC